MHTNDRTVSNAFSSLTRMVVKYDILRKLLMYGFIFLINNVKYKQDENFENFWTISACTLLRRFQNFGGTHYPWCLHLLEDE